MRYHNPLIDDVMELFHVTQDMIYEVMLLQGCNVQRVQDALCIEAKDFETYMSHSEQFVHEVPEIRISAH